jgi:hypothetical protein
MGFFNILETFFFISLAITFVLIMMLVYHFKGRICVLEQKCDTMFEIMNNIIKELKAVKMASSCVNPAMIVPNNETIMFHQRHNLGELFQQFQQDQFEDNDDDDESDDNDESDYGLEPTKIVVSDTEYEDEEQPVKIINIEFNEPDSNDSIDDLEVLEEENISLDDDVEDTDDLEDTDQVEDIYEVQDVDEVEDVSAVDITVNTSLEQSVDFKKMDISYLRTMVITRGLATDTKKMKKGDLINLLEDSKE